MSNHTLYINGRFLTQALTGVQRYAIEIVKALDEIITTSKTRFHDVILLTPKGSCASDLGLKSIKFKTGGLFSGHLWEQSYLAYMSRQGQLVNLCNSGPILHKSSFVIIHDATIYRKPEHFSSIYRIGHKFLDWCLARTSRIGTVSEFSRKELSSILGIGLDTIFVTPNGVDHFLSIKHDISILEKFELKKNKFFLFIGSKAPHKNLNCALKAFSKLERDDVKLVIAGGDNKNVFAQEHFHETKNIVLTGRLTDEQIACLYKNALALIFPSFYEGFGIPLLEAMAQSCPIIASDIEPFHEVCGDNGAVYFDPKNPEVLADILSKVILDQTMFQDNIETGNHRLKLFLWKDSAQNLLNQVVSVR